MTEINNQLKDAITTLGNVADLAITGDHKLYDQAKMAAIVAKENFPNNTLSDFMQSITAKKMHPIIIYVSRYILK